MRVKLGKNDLTLGDVCNMCGGELVLSGTDTAFGYICTDSREADENTAFIAIRGDRTDGHKYIGNVIENGCRAIICNELPKDVADKGFSFSALIVDDIYELLSTLAKEYCKSDKDKRVAVTGSVGKTTTKEYISAVLSGQYSLYKTQGNFNSTLGMPLSLLASDGKSEMTVLEMGMGQRGEISLLSRAAEPDIAVITNIGISHLEALGTRENICLAKLEIADGIKAGGTLILNGDEPLLKCYENSRINIKHLSITDAASDYFCTNIHYDENGTYFDFIIKSTIIPKVQINSFGNHNVYAAGFAFAVGILAGMKEEDIRQGLLKFKNAEMREQIINTKGITIIKDCYNACPDSMRAAIDTLCRVAGSKGVKTRKILLLGDMKELGGNSAKFHYEVGTYLADKGADLLFVLGTDAQKIADGAIAGGFFETDIVRHTDIENIFPLAKRISESLHEGDVLLIKASRSIRAERIADYIIN